MTREVTEHDFRMPEFRNANPRDYEFRDGDGKIVRKDRWERGIVSIVCALGWLDKRDHEWEIPDAVEAVKNLIAAAERLRGIPDMAHGEECEAEDLAPEDLDERCTCGATDANKAVRAVMALLPPEDSENTPHG